MGKFLGAKANAKALITERVTVADKLFIEQGIPINQLSGIDFAKGVEKIKLDAGTELVQWRMPGQSPNGAWYTLPGVDPVTLGLPAEYSVGHTIKLTTSVEVLKSRAGNIENFLKPAGNGEILGGGGVQYTTNQIKIGESAELKGAINRPK